MEAEGGMNQTWLPKIPAQTTSDYALLFFYLILVIIGAPVNLISFAKIHAKFEASDDTIFRKNLRKKCRNGMRLLKSSLNLSDLAIVLFYGVGKVCWLSTFSWRGGDALCRLVKCMDSTVFQLSSNLIVCIAVDRMLLVILKRKRILHYKLVKCFTFCAWISAPMLHFGQLFAWTVVTPRPDIDPFWKQCVTVWKKAQILNQSHYSLWMSEESFTLVNIATIFWIPLFSIILCYAIVVIILYRLGVESRILCKEQPQNKIPQMGKACGDVQASSIDTDYPLLKNRPDRHLKHFFNANNCSHPIDRRSDQSEIDDENRRPSAITNISSTSSSGVVMLSYEVRMVTARTVRTSFLLVSAYLLCWLPYNIGSFWYVLDRDSYANLEQIFRFVYVPIVLNAVVNPFLYGDMSCLK